MSKAQGDGQADAGKAGRRLLVGTGLSLPLLGALALWPRAGAPAAGGKTPAQTEGPFYPRPQMRKPDIDSDLVLIEGQVKQAGGEILHLHGQVVDAGMQPLAQAAVEIWQTDAGGRYLHTGDWGWTKRDAGFQGFGRAVTDAQGRFRFRTIKPVRYSGRTPHIHMKVFAGGGELTTQVYIKGHPQNANDSVYRRIAPQSRAGVEMALRAEPDGLSADVAIVV